MFLAAVVMGCFLALGCGDKKGKEAVQSGGSEAVAAKEEAKPVVWEGDYECKNGDAECRDDKIVGTGIYFSGTVFNTVVNADVTVRNAPNKNGESVLLAKKGTKVQVLGISKEGWINISVKDVVPKRGWVYGQYVDYKDGVNFGGVKAVDMKITGFDFTAKDSSTADLTAVYEVGGAQKTLKIGAFKEKGQKFYTFFYDIYVDGAHYIVTPGVYTWEFNKNLLKLEMALTRAPYAADDGEVMLWKKVRFTDNKKFFFVGDKAEKGAKAVLRVSDRKQLFDWNFSDKCNNTLTFGFKNSTVTFACPFDEEIKKIYPANLEDIDPNISETGTGYADENPMPSAGSSTEVACEVNLETGARKIVDTHWVTCE